MVALPSADLEVWIGADDGLVQKDEAPSGMLARGTYSATSRFTDDDNHTHLQYDWAFEIAKDW